MTCSAHCWYHPIKQHFNNHNTLQAVDVCSICQQQQQQAQLPSKRYNRPLACKPKFSSSSNRMGYDTMSSWDRTFFAVNGGSSNSNLTHATTSTVGNWTNASLDPQEHDYESQTGMSPVPPRSVQIPAAVPSFYNATSSWSPPPSPRRITRSGTLCSSPPRSTPSSPRADSVRAPDSPVLSMSAREKRKLGEKLYSASCARDLDHIRLLIHIGAPIDSCTMVEGLYEAFKPAKSGHLTPLAGAAGHGQLDAAELLLMHGASLNPSTSQSSSSPLHQAIRADDLEIARFLLEVGADVNGLNFYKTSPLMAAVKYASVEMIKLILRYLPDLSQMSFIGAAAIHWAVWPDRPEILELLLRAGADKNHAMSNGCTPLHCAASSGHLATTAMLLRFGADINKRNDECQTPLHVAEEAGHHDIMRLLQEAVVLNV